jgi:flagellar motility protein MotE (MotC chaperone)
MKQILLLIVITAVAAGVSSFVSSKLRTPAHAEPTSATTPEAEPGHDSSDKAAKPHEAGKGHVASDKTATSAPAESADLPVAARPKPMSVEEIIRYGKGIKQRGEHLDKRESQLAEQESQLRLVLADVQGEQKEIDGLRTQIRDQIGTVETLLGQLDVKRAQQSEELKRTAEQTKLLEEQQQDVDSLQRDNIKRMSAWFQNMEPAKAATFLKELSNDGKTDMAVQLLSNFEEREASKILAELDDPTLMVELVESFKKLKRAEKKKLTP